MPVSLKFFLDLAGRRLFVFCSVFSCSLLFLNYPTESIVKFLKFAVFQNVELFVIGRLSVISNYSCSETS